ncbi:MAG: cob(I)yrinic acid a,c-diamide adenosyltransferase [Desulfobacteraceae bacterium]|nr:cob(I)yrinic acid a,c-diamide adenosyltransferase [Desulfobacteraceae bacterium]
MHGYVQIYTGDGKGKTTAALGVALRAAGAGLKVYVAQFMKKGHYSEIEALKQLEPQVRAEQFGSGRFVRGTPEAEDLTLARRGFEAVHAALISGAYDLVIADEAVVAVAGGLLDESDLLDLIARRPPAVELILTGRGATQALMAAADLVTEMRAFKHYFENGVTARKGIEY